MSQYAAPSLNALTELISIRDYVLEAQRQLKAGKMPDMTSLEERTSDLCRIIREASSDVQQQCAPELKELARQLDDCELELRTLYEIRHAGTHSMTNADMESVSWLRVALAFVTVFGLIALMGFVLKYVKMRGIMLPGTSAQGRRLQMVETLAIDPRRRLVIVRCDEKEHLLLLGANEDVVVKTDLTNGGK